MANNSHEIREHYYAQLEKSNSFLCKERDDAEACHLLADFYERVQKKRQLATDVYKENCFKKGYADSCFRYGLLSYDTARRITRPEEHEKYVEEAIRANIKGCEVKRYNGACCHVVAKRHFSEFYVDITKKLIGEQNPKEGIELFKKGCEGEDSLACLDLARVYKDGLTEADVEPDSKMMFMYAQKACELQNLVGCQLVADAYKYGKGIERNAELCKKYENIVALMSGGQKARDLLNNQ